jgi:hypothetical protein
MPFSHRGWDVKLHTLVSRPFQRTSTSHSPPSPPTVGMLFNAILTRCFSLLCPVPEEESDPRPKMPGGPISTGEENSLIDIGRDIGEQSPNAVLAPRKGSLSIDDDEGNADNVDGLKVALRLESECEPAHIDSEENDDERWREEGIAC